MLPARPPLPSRRRTVAASARMEAASVLHNPRKLRVLALHSFRTSAAIFKQQLLLSQLDKNLEDLIEVVRQRRQGLVMRGVVLGSRELLYRCNACKST